MATTCTQLRHPFTKKIDTSCVTQARSSSYVGARSALVDVFGSMMLTPSAAVDGAEGTVLASVVMRGCDGAATGSSLTSFLVPLRRTELFRFSSSGGASFPM